MSVSRRIRRQVQRNTRNGLIRSGGFTGRRKVRAQQFLKSRAKREAAAARAQKAMLTDSAQNPLVSPRSDNTAGSVL